jgi:hypothetical protein
MHLMPHDKRSKKSSNHNVQEKGVQKEISTQGQLQKIDLPMVATMGHDRDCDRNSHGGTNSGVNAHTIINARCQGRLLNNSDHLPTLESTFAYAEYPKDFKPTNLHKYDGKQDPVQWLRLYSTAIDVEGVDTVMKALYFLMGLEPPPVTWLESLNADTIHSWNDLKKVFINNF